MRRIVIALCSTVTGLVLLLSWPTSLNRSTAAASGTTGTSGTGTAASGTTGTTTTTGTAGSAAAAGATPATSGTTGGTAAATVKTATYDGAVASTRYGDVQVRITVTDGVLTAAEAIAFPDQDGHSARINQFAVPTLNQEATAAKSAKISMVTGATYTSGGYVKSLQSALDQAGL